VRTASAFTLTAAPSHEPPPDGGDVIRPASLPARLVSTLAVLVAATSLVLAAGAPRGGPRIEIPVPAVVATERLTWTVPVRFINDTEAGLYVDSLVGDVVDLDPGITRAPRESRLPLNSFARLVSSISAGDTGRIQCFILAPAESAGLALTAYAHDAKGKAYVFGANTLAVPGPLSLRYPSQFLTAGGVRVECVFVPARPDTGLSPGVLIVHGEGQHARTLLGLANRVAQEGVAVMLVSQPGYGLTEGAPDFAGPATLAALEAALDHLAKSPGVDSRHIGVWGFSRGATAAALLAAKRPAIRALIAQSGVYDPWATHRGAKDPVLREAFEREAGSDSAAWRARSPIVQAQAIRAEVMVVHGEADDQAPVEQARAFAAALARRGRPTEASFVPGGHHLSPSVQRSIQDFLGLVLRR
jgi:dienelactone hydrolase